MRSRRGSTIFLVLVMLFAPAASSAQQRFETIVVSSPFADGVYWYLREPLDWLAFDGKRVSVPPGFVTDFASIPHPVWSILPKWEKYGPAAVVHDYLYWDQGFSRKQADQYLLEAMKDNRVSWLKRTTIYGAVRAFGSFSWRSNLRDKQARHVRVLKRSQFPTNPSETWNQCRRRVESGRVE